MKQIKLKKERFNETRNDLQYNPVTYFQAHNFVKHVDSRTRPSHIIVLMQFRYPPVLALITAIRFLKICKIAIQCSESKPPHKRKNKGTNKKLAISSSNLKTHQCNCPHFLSRQTYEMKCEYSQSLRQAAQPSSQLYRDKGRKFSIIFSLLPFIFQATKTKCYNSNSIQSINKTITAKPLLPDIVLLGKVLHAHIKNVWFSSSPTDVDLTETQTHKQNW